MNQYLSFIDLIFLIVFLIIFYMVGRKIRYNNIEREPCYKYFIRGMFVKVFGGIAVCLIYIYYYNGGDTVNYYHDNTVLVRLFVLKPLAALKFTFTRADDQLWFEF